MKPIASTKRRWLTLFILAIPWAQVNWGALVFKDVLRGWWYGLYWGLCLLLALVAAVLAGAELASSWNAWQQKREQCRNAYKDLLD